MLVEISQTLFFSSSDTVRERKGRRERLEERLALGSAPLTVMIDEISRKTGREVMKSNTTPPACVRAQTDGWRSRAIGPFIKTNHMALIAWS